MAEAEIRQTTSPEQTPNPERDRVIRLLHNFFEERHQNTPNHRLYAQIHSKENKTREEEEKIDTLTKQIFEEKNVIARELLLMSDSYRQLLNLGSFANWYGTAFLGHSAILNFNSPVQTRTHRSITFIVFNWQHNTDFGDLLDEIKERYNISPKEWAEAQKIDWSEEEKKHLQTLQQNAANYKENWKDEKVELEGHQFSSSREVAMKQLLFGAFIDAEYDRLKLPIVDKGRVTTDILTDQFVL